eukprot:TRINITY_DN75671_c0_g1_i1.p1 TRINITY_DN75671_c0_g1~~TRINITY_DN75671_c0_g1_i1.p1  ORF type:complete len:391 (-),score=64.55 TRINITY_DN75671_c0_g1_i1:116-1288(-)
MSNEWLVAQAGPNDAISAYISAPPRGMTHPPQNPKVRKKLMEQLGEYGVDLSADEWPWPRPEKPQAKDLSMSKTPKRSKLSCSTPSHICLKEVRSGAVASVARNQNALTQKWMVHFNKEHPQLVSNTPQDTENDQFAKSGNLAARPVLTFRPTDMLPSKSAMSATHRGCTRLSNNGGSGSGAAGSNVSAFAADMEPVAGSNAVSQSVQRPSSSQFGSPGTAKLAEETWQTSNKIPQRSYSDTDLRNNATGLRSAGRTHRAGVRDRYRLSVDLTTPGARVLSGAGSSANPPSGWDSDLSELNGLHSSAMRKANPSKMKVLPMPEKRRKKKGEEDETQLSESGLFFARYSGDTALKTVKELNRSLNMTQKRDEEGTSDDNSNKWAGLGLSLR